MFRILVKKIIVYFLKIKYIVIKEYENRRKVYDAFETIFKIKES